MVTVYDISDPVSPTQNQSHNFTLEEPGPNPDRQEAPHPHQVVLDPTGAFVVVPDLGADLVRVFAVGEGASLLEGEALGVEPGSGPRHVAFREGEDEGDVVMYLISELTNTISGFGVEYKDGGMVFDELFTIPTHGEGEEVPEGAMAAEILVSVCLPLIPRHPLAPCYKRVLTFPARQQLPNHLLPQRRIPQDPRPLHPRRRTPLRSPRHLFHRSRGRTHPRAGRARGRHGTPAVRVQ